MVFSSAPVPAKDKDLTTEVKEGWESNVRSSGFSGYRGRPDHTVQCHYLATLNYRKVTGWKWVSSSWILSFPVILSLINRILALLEQSNIYFS